MSDLADEYARQDAWRRWDDALAMVPVSKGQRVLDLGCGVGQVAARLHQRGATVVGVDANTSLIEAARLRSPEIRFVHGDVREIEPLGLGRVDGIWASFVAAYFPNLADVLARWKASLVPGGWIALTEIDDMFGHEPSSVSVADAIAAFYAKSRDAGGYDFEAGRKLAPAAREAGFVVEREATLDDDELSFEGAARPEILAAWRARFARMVGLKHHLGDRARSVEEATLAALAAPEHRSRAKIVLVVARAHPPIDGA